MNKVPLKHQQEAHEKLGKAFDISFKQSNAGILAMPTGSGKTFTAVNWIIGNIVSRGIKVLWLAQSSLLIDQAKKEFDDEFDRYNKDNVKLQLKIVSSEKEHHNSSDIAPSDEVVLITTQSAISCRKESTDIKGDVFESNFEKFIDKSKEKGLFIVLDEAHHAPAYGCRTLIEEIRKRNPKTHLLGLTATPTYSDPNKRGFLWKIFNDGILYQVSKNTLEALGFLAKPIYEESKTEVEIGELTIAQRNDLTTKHKEVPEDIIEYLAKHEKRNNHIADSYIVNKDKFGKTIIFVDRWYQSMQIVDRLNRNGIKAGFIFSKIDEQAKTADARNQILKIDNKKTIDDFRNNKLDVIVNVKMLTEGADFPDTKTVFITRQTTSKILMTQMIGRALRVTKDKKEANIVFFVDDWKTHLPPEIWAREDGGIDVNNNEYEKTATRIISLDAVQKAIDEQNKIFDPLTHVSFDEFMPVGWYVIKYSNYEFDNDNSKENTELIETIVKVHNNQKDKFTKLIEHLMKPENFPHEFGKEFISEELLEKKVSDLKNRFFDYETDDFGDSLDRNITDIIRHIGSNGFEPKYLDFFETRDHHCMRNLAQKIIEDDMGEKTKHLFLEKEYNNPDKIWKTLFNSSNGFNLFISQVQFEIVKILQQESRQGNEEAKPQSQPPQSGISSDEPDEDTKKKVKERDEYKCLCCGNDYKPSLQVDHITSRHQGGTNDIENLQTLCKHCNKFKGINSIDFHETKTPLKSPKNSFNLRLSVNKNQIEPNLRRSINFFYHCRALKEIEKKTGKVKNEVWNFVLHEGNDTKWILEHKALIESYIKESTRKDVKITAS